MSNIIVYFFIGGIVFLFIFIILFYFVQKLKKVFKRPEERIIPKNFKCIDGHIVKSKGELIIDNYLHKLAIQHEYENPIKIRGNYIKPDWYLPKYDIYIEYWGYYGKEYIKRKEEKIKLYRIAKLNLISIEDIMLTDIYSNLREELEKYVKLDEIEKHCPNCGIKLNDRF